MKAPGMTVVLWLCFAAVASAQVPPPTGGGGGGLSAVEDDPAPTLGGDLSVKGFKICDLDKDTCIELERTADQDIIWLSSLGTDIIQILNDGTDSSWTLIGDSTQTNPAMIVQGSTGTPTFKVTTIDYPKFRLQDSAGTYFDAGTAVNDRAFIDSNGLLSIVSSNRVQIDSVGTRLVRAGAVLWEVASSTNDFRAAGAASDGPALLHESPGATNPTVVARAPDKDSGLCSAGDDQIGLCAGGVAVANAVEGAADSLDVLGCKDFGTLVEPPASPSQCDRYYDSSGAQCFYNGTTWDKVGSGSCA